MKQAAQPPQNSTQTQINTAKTSTQIIRKTSNYLACWSEAVVFGVSGEDSRADSWAANSNFQTEERNIQNQNQNQR